MNIISWNLAGRLRRIPQQAERLASRTPDLVALQEVTQPGLLLLRTRLAEGGLIHQANSFELAPCPAILTGPRRYRLLIAGRFPMRPWEPGCFDGPWPEHILSVDIITPCSPLEMHTAHIPPGVTNGWIKSEAYPSTTPRLLCGDFNTPQLERSTGEEDNLLHGIQAAILNLRNRGTFGCPAIPLHPDDRSVQVHVCHSRMREVEVL
jgi:hypothetical protein